MEYVCYTISKSENGWTICACGRAVLVCKQKRTALTAAMCAKKLMLVGAIATNGANAIDAAPGGCDACRGVQAAR